MRECPQAGLRDAKANDFDPAAASHHALGLRGGEPRVGQIDQEVDLEAMREHDRLGAAVTTAGEQFERSAALLLRRRHLGSGISSALRDRDAQIDSTTAASLKPGPARISAVGHAGNRVAWSGLFSAIFWPTHGRVMVIAAAALRVLGNSPRL
jgi:hypothetical protein